MHNSRKQSDYSDEEEEHQSEEKIEALQIISSLTILIYERVHIKNDNKTRIRYLVKAKHQGNFKMKAYMMVFWRSIFHQCLSAFLEVRNTYFSNINYWKCAFTQCLQCFSLIVIQPFPLHDELNTWEEFNLSRESISKRVRKNRSTEN